VAKNETSSVEKHKTNEADPEETSTQKEKHKVLAPLSEATCLNKFIKTTYRAFFLISL
jgi:hypothetical protein